ncbi:hypothetical protein KCM76_10755 [Zooshikella marina]|uniref:hypothetical protein n=1 Tax=Zooshikella ganghwensis TaxID=202772 RepID=UPI001BAEE957|nr:hypothetical protein [Zooshikella ganghwensis]MBU2706466.1 hypothetical protein [Zooshikella ganghwensis]
MRYKSQILLVTFLSVNCLLLTACGGGSKNYRPVGASQPKNTTVQQTTIKAGSSSVAIKVDPKAKTTATPEKSTDKKTYYIRPGQHVPQSRSTYTPSPTSRTPINYQSGNNIIISKIAKTVGIHCVRQELTHSRYLDNKQPASRQTFCTYKFPEHCGGNRFSLIESGIRKILIYHDLKSNLNVLDSISLTPSSRAGIWHADDHVASTAQNVSSLFDSASADQIRLVGTLVEPTTQQRQYLTKRYAKAVSETSRCF